MRTVSRRRPSYRWLVVVLAMDVLGVAALLLNQWFEGPVWVAWAFAAGIAAAAFPWLLQLADQVFNAAQSVRTIPLVGEKNP